VSRATPDLDIRLLGPPEILVDGAPLVVDTRKAVAILVVLAADQRPYARDELAALLWPDADDAAARGALRRTLSALRTAVGDAPLRIDRIKVELVRTAVRIDLQDIERLARSTLPRDLARAADLARGPFLAGFSLRDSPDFDDWRAGRAMAAERTVTTVLDRLSEALAGSGDLPGAIAAATRRVELDPLDESAHVRLMDLFAQHGDRPAALRQYRICVATLERELGVPPLEETTTRYEAIRDAAVVGSEPPVAPEPADVPGPMTLPLVGRADALARLEAARSMTADAGRIVVLVGEAGIGKTRLAEAFADAVRRDGGVVVAARAHATERAIAYGPIVELLRSAMADPAAAERIGALDRGVRAELHRLLPTIDAPARPTDVDGPGARARLVAAIADGTAAGATGSPSGIVWLDDVQWADAASLEALAFLARRLGGRPFVLLLTWRHEDLDGPGLAFARQVESDAAATIIELDRLGRADIIALTAASTGVTSPSADLVDRLVDASEGLPLYVVEALARGPVLDDGLPDGVRAVLRQRLAAVGGTVEQVLAAAAAIGRSFDFASVRYASGRSEDEVVEAMDELMHRALIREVAGTLDAEIRYDFAHGALRDLVDESTSLARRRLLHRRIAEALRMDLGGSGRDDLGRLVQIAQHERDAGRDAEAAQAFKEAGDRAAALFANSDAIGLYSTALALGHPDAVGLHAAIGALRTRLGDYAGAIGSLEAAASLAEPGDLPELELALARAHIRRGDLVAADRHLEVALAASDDGRLRARMLVDRSVVRRRAGDLDGAATAATEALAEATRAGDRTSVGAAHRMQGLVALDRGDIITARRSLELAVAAADADPDPTASIAALVALAMAEAADGALDAGLGHGDAAVAACRRIGDRHLEAAVENHLADMLHAAGREDDAMIHLRRAVEAFAEVGGDPADPDPGIWMLAAS
jgi:DNA-binding SARP family transcriptional activator/tetratricopeptide (TPR) repeat protein